MLCNILRECLFIRYFVESKIQKDERFKRYLTKCKEKALEKQLKINEYNEEFEKGKIDEKKLKSKIDQLNKLLDDSYKHELDQEKLIKSTNNIVTTKEKAISNIMKLVFQKLNIKNIKNKTFEDVLLVSTFN